MLIQLPSPALMNFQNLALAGGTVTVTIDGEFVELFADADYSIPLSNPLVLDSSGYFSPLFCDEEEVLVTIRTNDGLFVSSFSATAPVELTLFDGINLANGVPNAAGFIHSYYPGSFSVQRALKDSDGYDLPNPVPLNNDGTIPYSLFVLSDKPYNLVMTTADGVVCFTTPFIAILG